MAILVGTNFGLFSEIKLSARLLRYTSLAGDEERVSAIGRVKENGPAFTMLTADL